MIKIFNNGIDAAINYMNYTEDARLKKSFPFIWGDDNYGDTPVAYRIRKEGDHLLLQGFRVNKTTAGALIHPKAEFVANGDVWVGRSDLFWNDYAVDGDGAPRFVAIANKYRDQNYPQFYVDLGNPVWVSVLEVSKDETIREFPKN
ncbi:hypothetical protein D3C71_78830 [compost metagenome]